MQRRVLDRLLIGGAGRGVGADRRASCRRDRRGGVASAGGGGVAAGGRGGEDAALSRDAAPSGGRGRGPRFDARSPRGTAAAPTRRKSDCAKPVDLTKIGRGRRPGRILLNTSFAQSRVRGRGGPDAEGGVGPPFRPRRGWLLFCGRACWQPTRQGGGGASPIDAADAKKRRRKVGQNPGSAHGLKTGQGNVKKAAQKTIFETTDQVVSKK